MGMPQEQMMQQLAQLQQGGQPQAPIDPLGIQQSTPQLPPMPLQGVESAGLPPMGEMGGLPPELMGQLGGMTPPPPPQPAELISQLIMELAGRKDLEVKVQADAINTLASAYKTMNEASSPAQEQVPADAQFELEVQKVRLEHDLKREEMEFKQQLAQQELQMKREFEEMKLQMEEYKTDSKIRTENAKVRQELEIKGEQARQQMELNERRQKQSETLARSSALAKDAQRE